MTKPNLNFTLNTKDIELIEIALRAYGKEPRRVQEVLGKIHNQKNWYRPKGEKYVSG